MKTLVAKTLEIAASRIGVREVGRSNRGSLVDEFNRASGAPLGSPWCAGFTYDNKQDAAEALGAVNPFIRSAYTPDIYNFAKERGILIPCKAADGRTNMPEAGDDFLVMGPVRIYHTGHVREAGSRNWWSIEGNSNSEGSNEGYEVASNKKDYAARFYWVRWSALVEEAGPLTRALVLGGKKAADVPVRENVTLAPVRKWAAWMGGMAVDWVGGESPVLLNGRALQTEISMIDGAAYAPVRDLAALDATLTVSYDAAAGAVVVSRK